MDTSPLAQVLLQMQQGQQAQNRQPHGMMALGQQALANVRGAPARAWGNIKAAPGNVAGLFARAPNPLNGVY
jgi:hypothetical protein